MNYILGKRILNILNHVIFPVKIQIYTCRCRCVYVWFKDDTHVIWMWIWLILKYISQLDSIRSLWFVRFALSPPSFIFWLGRLIFSVSINSHPDNIYIHDFYCFVMTFYIYIQHLVRMTFFFIIYKFLLFQDGNIFLFYICFFFSQIKDMFLEYLCFIC
jgi:hypothetical protein